MLEIVIPESKGYDEVNNLLLHIKQTKLQLEHSLLAIKKWEAKWHKAFLKKENKTDEELIDYVRCMTITTKVDPLVYQFIPPEETRRIVDYIEDPMSATVIKEGVNTPIKNKDVVTAELIYYWMITLNIPVEFQKWHLNQLITLINVIGIKNGNNKKRKLTGSEAKMESARRDAINMQRRAKYHTKG